MEPEHSRFLKRKSALWTERSSWDAHWKEIRDNLAPRRGRFDQAETNRGTKKNQAIYDSTGTRALRILAAGMMAGMTSPARPWFRLTLEDKDLAESASVKQWLAKVTDLHRAVFNKSNTYKALHTLYTELGAFATGASIMQADYRTVLHHFPMTIGEFAVATDSTGRVNTLYREGRMQAGAMLATFGKENVSQTVRNLVANNNPYAWVTIYQGIEPREERDPRRRDRMNMPFRSVYFENADHGKPLGEGGYHRFPCLTPRWDTIGTDIYGSGPGMDALGDLKQLQHEQLNKGRGIDYQTRPPIQVPMEYKGRELDSLPGGVTYVSNMDASKKIQTAFDVRLDLNHLLADIVDVRNRINQTFYADLFLMLINDTRSGITAREIAERHEEKLLMLGPVVERLQGDDLLGALIDNTFDRIVAAGILPPPPQELEAQDLKIEYVSMLAQAQRAVGLGGIDRMLATVGAIGDLQTRAGRDATAIDKIDTDQAIDTYSDMLGVDPDLIVADDKVAFIRQSRAEALAAQQAQAQAPQDAQTAKTLSETDTQGNNALTDIMRMFSGYGG